MKITRAIATVINDVLLELSTGEIAALLGPNGAEKSELFLGSASVIPLASGAVAVDKTFVNGSGIHAVRAAGIAAVPEGHQVLGGLSVIDNLQAADPSLSTADRDAEVANAFNIFPELRAL